jgi:hypothetical protein
VPRILLSQIFKLGTEIPFRLIVFGVEEYLELNASLNFLKMGKKEVYKAPNLRLNASEIFDVDPEA